MYVGKLICNVFLEEYYGPCVNKFRSKKLNLFLL